MMGRLIAAALFVSTTLAGCTAAPEPPAVISAETTCRQVGLALTVMANARIARQEGRSTEQELQGAGQLTVDLVKEIVPQPFTVIANAVSAMQAMTARDVLSAHDDEMGDSVWGDQEAVLVEECDEAGHPLGVSVWTGG